eukprot:3821676-Amphidinium_carterae.1
MGKDEQHKHVHECLHAGENPLGGTSEASIVPIVVHRLMLRPTAKVRFTGPASAQMCDFALAHLLGYRHCSTAFSPPALARQGRTAWFWAEPTLIEGRHGRTALNSLRACLLVNARLGLTTADRENALLPAATDKKPYHVAIVLPFQLDLVCQGDLGQRKYEEPKITSVLNVAVPYQVQQRALGLPAHSRGCLLLGKQQLLEPQPAAEAIAAAKQQDMVVELRRKLLNAGPCTCFEWEPR